MGASTQSNGEASFSTKVDAAAQVHLMLRDGLPAGMLDENEKSVFIEIYGEDALKKFEIPTELVLPAQCQDNVDFLNQLSDELNN